MSVSSPDPVADRASLAVVALVIGMLLVWAATADVLGGAVGLATAVVLGIVVACLGWRDRITYELVSNVGLVGMPVLIVALSIS